MSDVCISSRRQCAHESWCPKSPAVCRLQWTPPRQLTEPSADGTCSTRRLHDGVEGLMHVADEKNEELQGFDAVIP